MSYTLKLGHSAGPAIPGRALAVEADMATRRLRYALWQHRRSLQRQAVAQESAAEHLIGLAEILATAGRPEPARRLEGIALRFRVKAICLTARAEAVDWRARAWQPARQSFGSDGR
jgi:hypothetical protein